MQCLLYKYRDDVTIQNFPEVREYEHSKFWNANELWLLNLDIVNRRDNAGGSDGHIRYFTPSNLEESFYASRTLYQCVYKQNNDLCLIVAGFAILR